MTTHNEVKNSCFGGSFFGFPLLVDVTRQSARSSNYADVAFFFEEGYCPNGCQVRVVAKKIEKIFNVDCSVGAIDGVNKRISFKYVIPEFWNDSVATGVAMMFFIMVRNELNK